MKNKKKLFRPAAAVLSAAMALTSVPAAAPGTAHAELSTVEGYYLRGDVVKNVGVTAVDASAIQEYDARILNLDDTQVLAADANADGSVSISDIVEVLVWVAGRDKAISPVGEYVQLGTKDVPIIAFTDVRTDSYFNYTAVADGAQKLRFRHAAGSSGKINVIVDGKMQYTADITSGNETIVVPEMSVGSHIVMFTSDAGITGVQACSATLLPDDGVAVDVPLPTTTSPEETVTTTTTTLATTETTTTTTTTEVTPPAPQVRYYAADANIIGGVAETTNEGYEGANGYANVNNEVGSAVEWTVTAEDSNYELVFRYANGGADQNRIMQLVLNGSEDLYYIDFNSTGAWTTWDTGSIVVKLKEGENTIKLISTTENGGPNLDYVELVKTDKEAAEPITPVEGDRYYAIDAKTYKGWSETSNAGFAGTAYYNYDNTEGSYVEWTVEVPADGNYTADFRYANGTDVNRQVKLIVNGDREYGQYVDFNGTGAWTTWDDATATIALKKGTNTIKAVATTSGGGPNMDYLELSTTGDAAPHVKATKGEHMETLSRGVTSAHAKNGNLVSWRHLATDNEQTTFKLWRIRESGNTLLGEFTMDDASNYFDSEGTATDVYTIDTFVNGENTEFAQVSLNFPNTNGGQSGAYFDIPTQTPPGGTTPTGEEYTYTENDCSVGDVDGDGQYEVFVKWDPSNSKDNANAGYTGPVIIDCYKLDGTLLWRVDLGVNIRAGAHYTQFMVYDFDGDGKAEMICKTADGTKDGQGNYIGDKSKDYRMSGQVDGKRGDPTGKILSGPEYLTLFDGMTGKALDTVDYVPGRGDADAWGDTYGNRVDRMTGCVAYLDGVNAYACFGRGYYTRMAMTAWGVKNGKLSQYWAWDTGHNVSAKGYGDGNHHCMGADVDGDGKQEVVCGSVIIDDNGQVLNTTSLAHGDAIHIGDFDPSNPGLEIFQCLEDATHPNGTAVNYGVILRDAATAKVLFRETAAGDTGRCIADNIISGNGGAEMCGVHSGNVYSATGDHSVVCQWSDITKWGQNSVIYWTDLAERAVLDRTMADQYGRGRVFTGDGVTYNNYTKSNACLTCDLTGDWREEMIMRKSDGGLRVFTTTFTSSYNIYTLMHNPQYRVQVASQNNGYNQPPHTDFYLDSQEYVRPEEHDIWTN